MPTVILALIFTFTRYSVMLVMNELLLLNHSLAELQIMPFEARKAVSCYLIASELFEQKLS